MSDRASPHPPPRPPLPYTASDLALDELSAARTPAYYATHAPPSTAATSSAASTAPTSSGSGVPGRSRRARTRPPRNTSAPPPPPPERDVCCALIGPARPFWARASPAAYAASPLLPLPALAAFRILQTTVAVGGVVSAALRDPYSLRGTQLIALLLAAYCAARLAHASLRLRRLRAVAVDRADPSAACALHEPSAAQAHLGLLYQGTLTLQLFSPLSLALVLASEPDRTDIPSNSLYAADPLIIAPIAGLASLSLLDVLISSVPFRLTYILPIVLYGMLFMLISVIRFGSDRKSYYLGLSAAALLIIATLLLLLGRATNLLVRSISQADARGENIVPFDERERSQAPNTAATHYGDPGTGHRYDDNMDGNTSSDIF